jgi:hypothetical protein
MMIGSHHFIRQQDGMGGRFDVHSVPWVKGKLITHILTLHIRIVLSQHQPMSMCCVGHGLNHAKA